MIFTKTRIAGLMLSAAAAGAAVPTTLVLRGEGVTYLPRLVSTPDSTCLLVGDASADTASLWHTKSGYNRRTQAQIRAMARLDAIFATQCYRVTIAVDTVPDMPDPSPEDSLPQDSLPSDTLPTDTATVPDTTVTDTIPPVITDSSAFNVIANIGKALSVDATAAKGYGLVDTKFFLWEPTRWAAEGSAWTGNYYDRSEIYYAWFVRTGNIAYKAKGDAIALDYRRNYLHASNYQTSPHWSQLDGVALHYWFNGDDSSRIAVGKAAWNLAPTLKWARTGNYTDARQQGRALIGVLLAWQMNAPNAPAGGWAAALDGGLDNILSQQSPDGAWRYPVNTCDKSLNYMGAILADALMRVHDTYRRDPRIPVAVQKTADFLWTQWRNDPIPSFNYYEGPCTNQHGSAGATATPDLTGLFTTTYSWLSADPAYKAKFDAVFDGTMRGLYPQGSKQFNQAFTFTWRAVGHP